jgi:D-amino peptidase
VKAYISVDIEGATGIVSFSQCSRPESQYYDYAFARRMLTHDVNAAIRGLRAGGATEIVVKDSHATCKNLLIDELEPGTQLISGFGAAKDGMMDGIDASFDVSLLVGYHGMAGLEKAMMDHALVGGLYRFWINDVLAGEIAVSAAVAGAYGVPTILVTSDDVTCKEATDSIPGIHTYRTKDGFGRYMGQLLHPSVTGPGIEQAALEAVQSVGEIKPYVIEGPVTMRAEFRNTEEADLPALMEGVTRLDGYTLEWTRPDFMTAQRAALPIFNMSIQGRRSGT